MAEHLNKLDYLNKKISLHEKLIATHRSMNEVFPFIARIAVAIYDPKTGLIKTFIHSSSDKNPLANYQAYLDDVPSLKRIVERGLPRVINNFLTFEQTGSEHEKRIGREGYAASYTLPIFKNGDFFGLIFFNSNKKGVFTEKILGQIDIYAHLISLMILNESNLINTLGAAIKMTGEITHIRDPETGSHLDRMSRYSRLIAMKLADKYDFSDNFIEHIFMFSPLHDIGKIGIPDSVLLKPGKLTQIERDIMQKHPNIGCEIIDDLLKSFDLENIEYIDMLRNIIESHHEAINGEGYPNKIRGKNIPIEARIVTVADVFDALTSVRPYKEAWSNEKACKTLRELAGKTLDEDCVNALIDNMTEIELIQSCFQDDIYS
ncbi:HD domain-containing phosphohydrolase [Cognaticolwellia mytili]|uniref:HD domain-containing phosphohydrolase n=1 Tax=Cognaticolwellia mytili TaxID=1888913 RepID=UPI000A173CEE|nr:HD domain-containing phosphohydrolase [Cognaticolwellia mytili]